MNAVPKTASPGAATAPDSIYTPLEYAAQELRKRLECESAHHPLQDDALQNLLHSEPHAVMFRQIATPNYEAARFIKVAKDHNLRPLFIEFHQDRFLTMNPLKCALVRMRFSDGPGKTAGNPAIIRRIAKMPEADGLKLSDISTCWKQSLISFHHEMAQSVSWFSDVTILDGSAWFHSHGSHSREYYGPFLTIFHKAVLFEDFLLTDGERSFTEQVVIPAFNAAVTILGEKPLIVRLDDSGEAERREWFDYPTSLLEHVNGRLSESSSNHSEPRAVIEC
jgi:hypothetical protein